MRLSCRQSWHVGFLAVIGAGLLALLLAAPAKSDSFGTNLSRVPNNTSVCGQFLFPYQPATCSSESVDLATGESNFPPGGTGVVTQVRVRVGPNTGPMQIVVEEALRQDNPSDPGHPTYACCKAINASQVFTPTANATTPVNVNLPVRQDLTPEPSGYFVDDHLSLSVLDPNVPIPANLDSNGSDGLWFPAWQVGQERAGIYGTQGAMILFNADWKAGDAPGTGGDLVEVARTARVQGNKALLSLVCNLTTVCKGSVQLQNQDARLALLAPEIHPRLASTARAKLKPYGKRKFKIPAGKKRTVKVRLNKAGKRLLRGRKSAKVWAKVKLRGQAALPSSRVKLKK